MKRLLCLLLVIVLAGSVVGCRAKEDKESVLDIFEKYDSEMNEADIRKMHPDAYEFDPTTLVIDNYYYKGCNGSLSFAFNGDLILVMWVSVDTLENKNVNLCWNEINEELNWRFGKAKKESLGESEYLLRWKDSNVRYSLRPINDNKKEQLYFQKSFW